MNSLKKIELIIPVYNSKEFLPMTIESIEKQSFSDFRVIFVNDGSTDGTYEWLENRLQTVSFDYLLLNQENQGPSAARNLAIKNATAEWICFCDSDDVLSPKYLEYLYNAVSQSGAEMGYCQFKTVKAEEANQLPAQEELQYNVISAKKAMENHYTVWIAPVCLILNRKWFEESNIKYDEDCRYCEDLILITDALAYSHTVAQILNPLYYNIIRKTSLLRSGGTDKYIKGLSAFRRLEERMSKSETEAAEVFRGCATARFVLAVLRRAALQLSDFADFSNFAEQLNYKEYSWQERNLTKKWKIAGAVYRFSKRFFHSLVRMLFKD